MNKYILVFSLLTMLTSNIAHAAMIDDFTEEFMSVSVDYPPVTGNASVTSSTNISTFGSGRTISISKSGVLGANATVIAPLGIYAHSADALTSATSIISWHSDTAIDLLEDSTQIAFALDVLSIDQGQVEIILSVTDILGGFDSVSLLGAGAGLHFFNFTSFSSIDFLHVNGISLKMIGDTASDITLKSLSTVPTPSVLVLLVMGLIAFRFNQRIKI